MKNIELRHRFLYVDNEGTKFCMMKGSSENETVEVLCGIFAELEILVEKKCWLARVPSHSNTADKPSGGISHDLLATGFLDEMENVIIAVKRLFAFMRKKLGKRAECIVKFPK